MVSRTSPRVQASHEACELLHSSEVFSQEFGVEGLSPQEAEVLLQGLQARGVQGRPGDEVRGEASSFPGNALELEMLEVWNSLKMQCK